MYNNKKQLGQWGEQQAIDFLTKDNYLILEQNWRYGRAEIDIIASKENILIFFEVKTRTSTIFGQPEDFVSRRQQKMITKAAMAYIDTVNHQGEIQFDIISILHISDKQLTIRHIPDAFFLGLE